MAWAPHADINVVGSTLAAVDEHCIVAGDGEISTGPVSL